MKPFIMFIFLFVPLQITAEQAGLPNASLSGFVKTNSGQAITGVAVTNGFRVTTTDAQGAYSLPRTDSVEFVYITVPSEYTLPVDDNNLPLFYKKVDGTGNFTADFTLTPFTADELKADLNHVLIASGDPQVYNDYDSYLFGKESVEDMKTLAATYPAGTHIYGACVGDLVWDQYTRFAQHTANCKMLGFPVFQVIGNHDHDRNIRQDWGADHYYKENYGPTYYSVNRGNIHYVALDDIEYTNATGDKSYNHNIVDYQMQWLAQDLAQTPETMQVVFLIHAPIAGSSVANRRDVYDLVNNRRNTHAISGHQHVLRNYEISSKFYDHTLPAVGGLWNGYLQSDGTPPGYAVFQAGSNGFTSWFFKSTGWDKSHQMRVYPVGSFVNGESMANKIIANIWNYDSKWSEVAIYENGAKHVMYQYSGIDPLTRDFLMDEGDTRPNYGGTDVGQPSTHNLGASVTPHIFYYEPADANADFEVEVTDRFGTVYREKVLKNLMTASFTEQEKGTFYYRQNFDDYRSYPNQIMGTTWGKCTYVQGHSPTGWYHAHSGALLPAEGTTVNWSQYNYIRVSNGASDEGGLYAFGSGAVNIPASRDSDQAMGSLNTSSAREIQYGVLLENNTRQTLNGVELSYAGEVWRGGLNPARGETLTFSYAVNPDVIALRKRTLSIAEIATTEVDTLAFVSPATTNAAANTACDGNAPLNRTDISGKIAARLYPGDVILLRWKDRDEAGADNALAIDNLVVKAIVDGSTAIDERNIANASFYNVGATVYFDQAPMSEIHLFDAAGMLIHCREVMTGTMEIPALPKGVYFLKTKFGTKKIIF